jgi:lysophosphatidate acyltransferase
LAQQAQVPIIPIVVSNTSTLINSKTKTFETGEIIIHVLPPMSTEGLKTEDVGAFTEKVRDAMLKEIEIVGYSIPDSLLAIEDSIKDNESDEEYESVSSDVSETDGPAIEDHTTTGVNAERTSLLSKTDP